MKGPMYCVFPKIPQKALHGMVKATSDPEPPYFMAKTGWPGAQFRVGQGFSRNFTVNNGLYISYGTRGADISV
jgi:hypothetical protein